MRIYHWFIALYAFASILALAAIPLSAAGWITPDPLSALPAMLLGLPWSAVLLRLGGSESTLLNVFLVALAMATNTALLWLSGRLVSRWWRR